MSIDAYFDEKKVTERWVSNSFSSVPESDMLMTTIRYSMMPD